MERIAEGVHLVRGGLPRVMNVYLIEDEGKITVFDAGIKGMHKELLKAAAPYGGIRRVVLGHSHTDHRGAAPELAAAGVPVYCHAAELNLIAVHPGWARRGVGRALLDAVIELTGDWLNMHRLGLIVFVDNTHAIRLYREYGFEIEGTLRGYGYKRGRYVDAHVMARL